MFFVFTSLRVAHAQPILCLTASTGAYTETLRLGAYTCMLAGLLLNSHSSESRTGQLQVVRLE